MVSGGMKKVERGIKVSFTSPVEKGKLEYTDKFTEEFPTLEDVKAKYGKVVWCQFTKCKYNEVIKGLQRITGTLLKNKAYNPLNEQEHIWTGVCNRSDEIAIRFDEVTTPSGTKAKIPSCFSSADRKTGRPAGWHTLLQSDGSPLGGNIDSQNVSTAGYGGLDSNSIYGR